MTSRERASVRGLRGNSIALVGTTHIAALLGYAFWLLCARRFPSGVIGISNTVIAAMTLVAILTVAGFIPMLPRLLPGADPQERSGLCSTALLVTAVISGLVGAASAFLMPEGVDEAIGTVWLVVFSGAGAIGTAMMLVSNAALLGVRRAELSLLGTAAGSLARLAAVVMVPILGVAAASGDTGGINTVLGIWVISLWMSSALSITLLARATPGFRFSFGSVWLARLRDSAGWDHLAMVAVRAPALALPIIAAVYLPPSEVGHLVVAAMIASAFLAVPGAVSWALLADCADDPERLPAQLRRAVWLIQLMLVVPALGAGLLAPKLLGLFGPGYADYSLLLILLLVSAFPDVLINLALTTLRIQQRLSAVAVVTSLGTVITIGGTCWLMPYLGGFSVAAAILTSQMIVIAALAAVLTGAHLRVTGELARRRPWRRWS